MERWKRRLMERPPLLLLLYFPLLILGQPPRSHDFLLKLNATAGSFVQLSDWHPTTYHHSSSSNWTLSLDFRTNISSGLLLYADDHTKRAFLHLRLQSSQLECRLQTPSAADQSINAAGLTGDAQSVRVGHDLNDNQWHTVVINKRANVVVVRLQTSSQGEEVRERLTLPASGKTFDGPVKMFVGGLPGDYSVHFNELAAPSVVFEPRFNGMIKSVFYNTENRESLPQLLKQAWVEREILPSLCEADELPTDIAFSGRQVLHFIGLPSGIDSPSHDQGSNRLSMQFRSRQVSGLLTQIHTGSFSIDVGILDDCFTVKLTGESETKTTCEKKNDISFGDFSLHNYTLEITNSRLTVSLDGNDTYWNISMARNGKSGQATYFTDIYLGGSISVRAVQGDEPAQLQGFQGTVSKVIFRSGYRTRNLHNAVKVFTSPSITRSSSELDSGVTFQCETQASSYGFEHIEFQFCNPTLFLSVPEPENRKLKQVSLRLRTTEPHGLILFYLHPDDGATFTAVDMYDGNLNVFIHRGANQGAGNSGSPRITVPSARIDDGAWHNLTLSINELSAHHNTGTGFVKLDDAETEFVIAIPGGKIKEKHLESTTTPSAAANVYFGGAPSAELYGKHSDFWSIQLGHSFRGLLKDIRINTEPLDEEVIARWSDEGCPEKREERRYCDPNPCFNAGRCREGWQRFVCDCGKTLYGGLMCEKELQKVDFNGTFLLAHKLTAAPSASTDNDNNNEGRQITSASFRFRTAQLDTILLRAIECPPAKRADSKSDNSNNNAPNSFPSRHLTFTLRSGRMAVRLSLANDKNDEPFVNEWELPGLLGDQQWHSVRFARAGPQIHISVDERDLQETVSALEGFPLTFCRLEIGGITEKPNNRTARRNKRGRRPLRFPKDRQITTRKPEPSMSPEPFTGTIHGLVFDGIYVLESNQTRTVPIRKVTDDERRNGTTFTFQTSAGYLELETLQAEVQLDIKFSFKTSEGSGLFLFNGKPAKDFIAVELARGNLHFIFDLGNGPQILRSSQPRPLSDRKWHTVQINRPKRSEYTLSIDKTVYQTATPIRDKSKLDLSGKLYLGGIPKSEFALLPRSVVSRHGFMGCVRELSLNGQQPDLAEVSREQTLSGLVAGCTDSGRECRPESCKNGGRCEHQGNGVLCDCDMTSYSGPLCTDYSISYRFGPESGLIIYHFDPAERLDSRNDQIAFGVVTSNKEAIIGRVASFTSDDVIEFQIVDGHLFVIYNMGKIAHLVTDLKHRLNDGQYHVVRFQRSGANATIQIDTHPPVSKEPLGPQLDVFNGISTVEVGGKLNEKKQAIERAFTGVISGFVLNGIRILDLAADNDSNIVTDGAPEVVMNLGKDLADGRRTKTTEELEKTWLDEMQHMETTHSLETASTDDADNDDLITAVAPACQDEDESCMLTDSSKGDDLIIAQYTVMKMTTPSSPQLVTSTLLPVISAAGNVPCDDEDCDIESSGSGDDSLLLARSAVARTTRVFYVSFNTTLSTASVTSSSSSLSHPSPSHNNGPTRRIPGSSSEENNGRVSSGFPRSGVAPLPAPTLSTAIHDLDGGNILVEYAAIIAGIAIGIIFLVFLIVFVAVRYRGGRTEAQVAGKTSGKLGTETSQSQEGGQGTSGRNSALGCGGKFGTLRVNPRDDSGGEGRSEGRITRDRDSSSSAVGRGPANKDKEWYV
ncbi:Neurexin-1 [Hypsibius exemplaris]|uniref:Neurexin-1 n=1 Tax=Hypsibius exemplaris TaxID=2072580 RepID=A0A1W0WZL6_HYPEX|nr:Neurexin-1 [Hypsibius exemplaris]